MVGYGSLLVREMPMIVFFYCFTTFWSSVVAILSITFTVSSNNGFRNGLIRMASGIKHWARTTVIHLWSWASGKQSLDLQT